MAQLLKGTNYTATGDSSFVTHTNLNAHVSNAKLIGGAIDEQIANAVSDDQDLILINKGGELFKQTKGQFTNNINANSINANNVNIADISSDTGDFDKLSMTGDSGLSWIDVNNAFIINTNTSNYNINFGFGVTNPLPAPANWTGTQTYNFLGGTTNFTKGKNVATNAGHNVNIDGNVSVSGSITSNGKAVITDSAVAMKSGKCGDFGSTILYKSGLFDIPADETWIFTFLCHFTTGQTGNTRPDGYYTITAYLEKDTYSDVPITSWTKPFPPYGVVAFLNTAIKLTRNDLGSMSKRLKFVCGNGVVSATSDYSILLSKVKTANFTTDSSIL